MEFKENKGKWHIISISVLDQTHLQIDIILDECVKSPEKIKATAELISKTPQLLESLKELLSWSAHLPQIANGDIERAQQLIKEATTI